MLMHSRAVRGVDHLDVLRKDAFGKELDDTMREVPAAQRGGAPEVRATRPEHRKVSQASVGTRASPENGGFENGRLERGSEEG